MKFMCLIKNNGVKVNLLGKAEFEKLTYEVEREDYHILLIGHCNKFIHGKPFKLSVGI